MIGFNDISYTPDWPYYQPGLGNQMYQYASLMGIAAYKGYEFCVPLASPVSSTSRFLPSLCFKLEGANFRCLSSAPEYKNSRFEFNQKYMEECPDGVTLCGYSFFSVNYFNHIQNEVRKAYTFKSEILDECLKIRRSITSEDVIAIQVRRGDYLGSSLGVCTEEYYLGAIKRIDDGKVGVSIVGSQLLGVKSRLPKKPILVFSDDPIWCISVFKGDRFRFVIDKDSNHSNPIMARPQQDVVGSGIDDRIISVKDYRYSLCLMTLCNEFIISNSTFGIWGAWLAENVGRVIRPTNLWVSENFEARDYYPKEKNWSHMRGW